MTYRYSRLMFETTLGAAEALLFVLEHANETDKNYSFGPLNVNRILASGLILEGDIDEVLDLLTKKGLGAQTDY